MASLLKWVRAFVYSILAELSQTPRCFPTTRFTANPASTILRNSTSTPTGKGHYCPINNR
ncbi:hypothetical protein ASPTUDRAFT_51301 [Aspergillus tubingensis CBS 134.48]|uniref:Uncharacterized protein n=1 Tax=Aspergillus tubingensis (strain CBS 134.48) TaxID=767770 RepID=A0A1L9NEH3_ASPTC|nr:hypothetical protein ASPTUDRAFT_51301 [Aspergillus tubingensis CBS 134.48]